ncbi:agmatinase [Streptomyces sp. Sge12]|uniref:agmatinase n=1 Tax=Streptomyces sp. Sge12 TaxID=1972846 RepID=UPI0009C26BDF|nr:agmatinase [Streptomyces sp. Sge12]ARE74901.1 agmatinase [Streptomyces sp. Sge12]
MHHLGSAHGPDITFLGVPRLDLSDPPEDADVVILGAPFDGGTSHRPGARFGPSAMRQACYLPQNGARRSLAMGVDPLTELKVYDAGDVPCYSGDIEQSIKNIEQAVRMTAALGAVPVVLGGDHTIALPDMRGLARHHGFGRIAMLHFDAHADTGEVEDGPLYGHGKPMRQLIESGAVRGDRFLQIGLRGYWPGPDTLRWMAGQGMRSYEMSEITSRGLPACLTEAFAIATDDCDGVFLSVDVDVVDPGQAPGTGTPEPGGLTSRELLDAVRRIAYELPVVGVEVVEVAPPYDHAEITAYLGNRVVLEALSGIARRRRDLAPGTTRWDPRTPLLERDMQEGTHR